MTTELLCSENPKELEEKANELEKEGFVPIGISSDQKMNVCIFMHKKASDVSGNLKRLENDYEDKLNLVDEIQKRTDSLGSSAKKADYSEWRLRNSEAVDSGEHLASYIREHLNELNSGKCTDLLVLLATNKERLERDNQALTPS